MFPAFFTNLWSLLGAALTNPERDFSKFGIGIPRGHCKTTFLKLLTVFIILFTRRKFILIVCATEAKALAIIADVIDILDSPNIAKVFGNWRTDLETDRVELKKFRFRGRNLIITGIGSGGAVRGLNLKNERPDVMLMDDLQTKEEAKSEVISKALTQWMYGTLMKAKSPKGCLFLYVGNMYPDVKIGGANSDRYACILRNLQKSPNWTTVVVGGILADGTALWEELQPLTQLLQELEEDLAAGVGEVFFSEVMNDPTCGMQNNFDISRLPKFEIDPELNFLLGKFILIDPSLGKKTSDDQVVMTVEVYDTGVPIISNIEVMQLTGPALVDAVITKCLKEGIPLVCAEAVAYQEVLLQFFEERVKQLDVGSISFKPVTPQRRSKVSRILSWFLALMTGKVEIHPKCLARILAQISLFDPLRKSNKDDILDTGAYVEDVMILYPNDMLIPSIFNLESSDYSEIPNSTVF
jgi:hypothetical protein